MLTVLTEPPALFIVTIRLCAIVSGEGVALVVITTTTNERLARQQQVNALLLGDRGGVRTSPCLYSSLRLHLGIVGITFHGVVGHLILVPLGIRVIKGTINSIEDGQILEGGEQAVLYCQLPAVNIIGLRVGTLTEEHVPSVAGILVSAIDIGLELVNAIGLYLEEILSIGVTTGTIHCNHG